MTPSKPLILTPGFVSHPGGYQKLRGSTWWKPPGISRAENIPLSGDVKDVNAGVKRPPHRRKQEYWPFFELTFNSIFNIRFNKLFEELTFRLLKPLWHGGWHD